MSNADLSEAESDTSSVMGDSSSMESSMKPPSPASREQLQKRIESLVQENRVLTVELETYRLRVKALKEENRTLKEASVLIQAKAEQEEEFISNTLLKKIQELKREKETLALNYEQEEECLTNDLSRKLNRLRQEKSELAQTLQQEQESLVNKLLRRIKKLENETSNKQSHLEQLRREKVELENTLEQEQEALVNRLWKRMDKLEGEKRGLQEKLEQPLSAPPSPMDISLMNAAAAASTNGAAESVTPAPSTSDTFVLAKHIGYLRGEVAKLKQQLRTAQNDHSQRMMQLSREEQQIREENIRLQRKLQLEVDRREQLCRTLSESESSLEMEDERHFNELTSQGHLLREAAAFGRSRTASSPVFSQQPVPGRMSPATTSLNVNTALPMHVTTAALSPPSPLGCCCTSRCTSCGVALVHPAAPGGSAYPAGSPSPTPAGYPNQFVTRTRSTGGNDGNKFVRPTNPPTPTASGAQRSE